MFNKKKKRDIQILYTHCPSKNMFNYKYKYNNFILQMVKIYQFKYYNSNHSFI